VQRGSGSKPIQKPGKFNNFKKRQQKQQEDEEESEVDSEKEFNRVMQEEDPELEKDLLGEDGAIAAEDEDIQMEDGDEGEFVDDGGDLDLPDEEEVEDNEDDLKGEDTDSDLEEYYRELGIETDEKD
jgi:hypothetical protein